MKKKTNASLLEKDSKLNAEFDKLKKYAAPPVAKTVKPPRNEPRRRGRPSAGRLVFQQRRIESLPRYGNVSEIAKCLGIWHTTLQQWCDLDKHPLPFSVQDGHKVFRKDILVEWLVATKRYTRKLEYEES